MPSQNPCLAGPTSSHANLYYMDGSRLVVGVKTEGSPNILMTVISTVSRSLPLVRTFGSLIRSAQRVASEYTATSP
jgi:hypothetical protein